MPNKTPIKYSSAMIADFFAIQSNPNIFLESNRSNEMNIQNEE